VKNRIERLMPMVAGDDFEARYPVFLGDKIRKYDHDFLGWTELKALAGDSEQSRALIADILTDKQSRSLLLAIAATPEEAFKMLNARRQEYGPKVVNGRGWVQGTPALHDVAALLLAEVARPELPPSSTTRPRRVSRRHSGRQRGSWPPRRRGGTAPCSRRSAASGWR